jgi:CHAT domain-containing protein
VAVFALLVVMAVEGPFLLTSYKLSQAQKQIGAAFVNRRTIESRLSHTDYSSYRPFPIELGAENGRGLDEVPASLHDATSAANQNLQTGKADPRWWQIQGRALLWETTPSSLEKAEKDFETAQAKGVDSASLEIDLAATYFERDNRTEHPNLQRTLNLLNKVLNRPDLGKDDRATALFNLAIAYEKTQAWDLAVSTWDKYLQVDSSSGWANEAQQHLQDAKAKLQAGTVMEPLDPAAFLAQISSKTVQDQAEDYQDIAVGAWLPDAMKASNPVSLNAIHALADLLAKQHSDPWLENLTSSLQQKDLPAVTALADAMQRGGSGDTPGAIKQAESAAKIFAQRGNSAGEFRAELEEVNAFRRALDGKSCLARAGPLGESLSKTKYRWLQVQVSFEKADCGNLTGEFAKSDIDMKASRELASQFGFPLVELRNIGISSGNKHLRGNCDESWQEAEDGLHVYWQAPIKAHSSLFQFYAVMSQCALETGALDLGEALLRRSLELRETSSDIKKNKTIEGLLHLELANVLAARKANTEAGEERKNAQVLVGAKGLSPQADLFIKLQAAEFQRQNGNAESSLASLESLRKALPEHTNAFSLLSINQALGNTYSEVGKLDDAITAYKAVIRTSELSLDGIQGRERLQWLRSTDESYRGLVRALIKEGKTEEALEQWEIYKSRPLLRGEPEAFANNAPNEQQKLGLAATIKNEPGARIIYANFKDDLYVWVSSNGHLTGRWIGIGKQDFESMTREFAEKCAVADSDLHELNTLGEKLFAALIQPVLQDLSTAQPVTVELDRIAYNLPMEALSSPEGWYFGEKYAVVYSPGIAVEETLRASKQLTGREPLLLLDASHVQGAGYLPGFDSQRNTIEKLFQKAMVVDTERISWTQLRSPLISSQIIHYMGHGKPDGSGTDLDYAGNKKLTAKDFSPELFRNTQLVLLAACSGAAGRDNGIADTNNLVRSLLVAGVPSVIASHWNVDSASTSHLMVSFYEHLMRKESVAQAMYNARIDVLRKKGHPYFWAGFTLEGRPS